MKNLKKNDVYKLRGIDESPEVDIMHALNRLSIMTVANITPIEQATKLI